MKKMYIKPDLSNNLPWNMYTLLVFDFFSYLNTAKLTLFLKKLSQHPNPPFLLKKGLDG